jgi:hypothetical protein
VHRSEFAPMLFVAFDFKNITIAFLKVNQCEMNEIYISNIEMHISENEILTEKL